MAPTTRQHVPQAFTSSYAPRLRSFANPILTPVIAQSTQIPSRTTKRGTAAVNYAEDGFDDDDLDDSEGPRRPTGLRSLRRDETTVDKSSQQAQRGKDLTEPVQMQGIWRDWLGRQRRQMWVVSAFLSYCHQSVSY
jgi:chromatin structure-remodeling complex subunit SFH1